MDMHASRIGIFNATLELIRQEWYPAPSGERVELPSVEEVMGAAVMYREPVALSPLPAGPVPTEVRVENRDCVLAAKALIDAGFHPAMLNLADLYTPGGLVEYGSGAQEENPYNIPVISVAALNGPRVGADGLMLPAETAITLDKMRTIFRIGVLHGHDSLVLSAMGCGAFANPPAHIARLFHQVIGEEEFRGRFRLIDFAILDGYRTGLRHNPDGNLLPFQREFGCNH